MAWDWLIGTGLALDWLIGTGLADWHQIGLDWIRLDKIGLENWKIVVGTNSWPPTGTGFAQD